MARSRPVALAVLALAVVLALRPPVETGTGDAAVEMARAVVGPRPVAAAVVPRTEAPPAPPLEIHGSGWGHGVGMSQYGAQAQALDGRSAAQILAHYYPGTGLAPAGAANPAVRVGLFANRLDVGEVHLAARGRRPGPATSPVRVRLSPGQGAHELPADQAWRVRLAGAHYELLDPAGQVVDRQRAAVRPLPSTWAGSGPSPAGNVQRPVPRRQRGAAAGSRPCRQPPRPEGPRHGPGRLPRA